MVDCILLRNNEHYGAYRLLLVIIMVCTDIGIILVGNIIYLFI